MGQIVETSIIVLHLKKMKNIFNLNKLNYPFTITKSTKLNDGINNRILKDWTLYETMSCSLPIFQNYMG